LGLKFWPEKSYTTIPNAVRWFVKEHGTSPEIIVSKSKSRTLVQDIAMHSSKAPTPVHRYCLDTYGKILGEARYKELISFEMHKVRRLK
jgi:hypothetical protein